MNARDNRWMMMFPLAFLIMVACNFFTPNAPSGPTDVDALYTQAAATLSVQLTQSALGGTATTFPLPGQLPTATPTSQVVPPPATVTPLPTATRQPPAATSVPPTRVPPPCLAARFVKDISVEDGTKFSPSESFTKTWEIENVGSCTWNEDYRLIFVKGDQMGGDDEIPIEDTVSPGETIRLSVDLVAPLDEGEYRGDWMLESDEGDEFGIGAGAGKTFWVSIDVTQPDEGVIFSFVNAYCSADWESSSDDDLPCPGDEDDDDGFVIRLEEPDQENRTENEPALWTNPAIEDDGWITGTYPSIEIQNDDRFIADVGCLDDNEDCDVIFRLDYKIGSDPVETLGEWHEVFDDKVTRIDVDLSDLEDEKVKFILVVTTNGDYDEDAAFWLQPHILRED